MIDPGQGIEWRVGQVVDVYRRGRNPKVVNQRRVVRVTKTMVILDGGASRYTHRGTVVGCPLAEYRIRPTDA